MPGSIPEVKKISIDQWLRKYCLLGRIQAKRDFGDQVWFVPNRVGWAGVSWDPRKNFQLLPSFNLIQYGPFRGCSRMRWGGKKTPLPKACDRYPTMMKLGTVILYLKKIKKIHESRDTRLEFCCHQHFVTRYQQILLTKKYG